MQLQGALTGTPPAPRPVAIAPQSAHNSTPRRSARQNLVLEPPQTRASAECSTLRQTWQRLRAGMAGAAAFASLALLPYPADAAPFLSSTGAKGPLAQEEERLYRLRREIEGEARMELDRARVELEQEGRESQFGKLCATPFGVDIVGITELIALTGALVGGFSARQRKDEVERLNEQLRKINLSLRQQARIGTIYAPGLNYAPPPVLPDVGTSAQPPPQSMPEGPANGQVATAGGGGSAVAVLEAPVPPPLGRVSPLATIDEDDLPPEKRHCLQALREGKRLLKQRNGASAMVRFEKALMLAKSLGEKVQERRATRGLAASARLQGQHQAAIRHLERVLEISRDIGEHVGDADAYGTIADMYTEMGQYDKAAKYYDKYISSLNNDGPV